MAGQRNRAHRCTTSTTTAPPGQGEALRQSSVRFGRVLDAAVGLFTPRDSHGISCRTAIAIKCKDGIVFAVEKMVRSKMLVEGSNRRIHTAAHHVGIACAGFTVILSPWPLLVLSRINQSSRLMPGSW
jgi:hypothetical protein